IAVALVLCQDPGPGEAVRRPGIIGSRPAQWSGRQAFDEHAPLVDAVDDEIGGTARRVEVAGVAGFDERAIPALHDLAGVEGSRRRTVTPETVGIAVVAGTRGAVGQLNRDLPVGRTDSRLAHALVR